MNRIPFFTASIAREIQAAMDSRGLAIPVLGAINPPEPEHLHAEVLCNTQEEIIPGNDTYRLDCSVAVSIPATEDPAAARTLLEQATAAVLECLHARWRYRPLPDPRPEPERDPEYAANPFLVLALIPTAEPLETSGASYQASTDFRAYVQF